MESDKRFGAQTTLCLLTILIAAKRSGMAQLRYQKREKAIFLPKKSINVFDVSSGRESGGLERNVKLTFLVGKIDM